MQTEKLVRDKIPTIIMLEGDSRSFRIALPNEMPKLLSDKLAEESKELGIEMNQLEIKRDALLEELADATQVIYQIVAHFGISWRELEAMMRDKAEKKGAFKQGVVLKID